MTLYEKPLRGFARAAITSVTVLLTICIGNSVAAACTIHSDTSSAATRPTFITVPSLIAARAVLPDFQAEGGDQLSGGFLSSHAEESQFSGLNLAGGLINTGDHIRLVSNFSLSGVSSNLEGTPEPGTLLLVGSGFVACAGLLRRSSRRPNAMRNGP